MSAAEQTLIVPKTRQRLGSVFNVEGSALSFSPCSCGAGKAVAMTTHYPMSCAALANTAASYECLMSRSLSLSPSPVGLSLAVSKCGGKRSVVSAFAECRGCGSGNEGAWPSNGDLRHRLQKIRSFATWWLCQSLIAEVWCKGLEMGVNIVLTYPADGIQVTKPPLQSLSKRRQLRMSV